MMLYAIPFIVSLVLSIFFWPDPNFFLSPTEVWVWNKNGGYGTRLSKTNENPLATLNGYKTSGRFFNFENQTFRPLKEGTIIDYPLLGKGTIEYSKIGDSVSYYSSEGEVFWTKLLNSYPRAGLFSSPLLFLSGDNNTVFLMDHNGNPIGLQKVDGRFLTDFVFCRNHKGVGLLFLGGEIYRLDESGNLIFSLQLENESFAKSIAISPNGDLMVIHKEFHSEDFLQVIDENGKSIKEIKLSKIFPFHLSMAIADTGEILLNTPGEVLIGKELEKSIPKKADSVIYQATFAHSQGFVFELDQSLMFSDTKGIVQRTKPLQDGPVRLYPGKSDNTFYLETQRDIYQFHLPL